MKRIIFLLSLLLALSLNSCKEECKICEIEVFYEGIKKESLGSIETYCGEVLDIIESEPETTEAGLLKRVRLILCLF